ncbi:MAG: U32 family peptidase [Clostridia bacterium]|nr:U32 family peptidase [Clostridia bacterium]
MIEILAPVGSPEHLPAAVRSGADAVYLGLKSFSARASAANFSQNELTEAVRYCHASGVRVFVTVNTIIRNGELSGFAEALRTCCGSGVDGAIIQDLAAAELIRCHCPDLPMHASTQMAVHNSAGVKRLEKMGFVRAVLARELSLREIAEVRKNTSIELEVFIHGALCVSMSGGCLASAFFGGRSANRGECAGPCRLDFRTDKSDYALSLKDLGGIDFAKRLDETGIDSLKIEGRLKSPEYVAATVHSLRTALDGGEYDRTLLEKVFSRSGFTDGYFTGRRTHEMFGRRDESGIAASKEVESRIHPLYRTEMPRVALSGKLILRPGPETHSAALTLSDGTNSVCCEGQAVEPTDSPLDAEAAKKAVSQLGGTPFYLAELGIDNPGGLSVRLGELKRLRRGAAEKLCALRSQIRPIEYRDTSDEQSRKSVFTVRPASPDDPFRINEILRFESVRQIPVGLCEESSLIVLPLSEIRKEPGIIAGFGHAAAELPYFISPSSEAKTLDGLCELKDRGLRFVRCENLGAAELAAGAGLIPCLGFGFNILNRVAFEKAVREFSAPVCELSVEHGAKDLYVYTDDFLRNAAPSAAAVVYGHVPLMRFRACPLRTDRGCENCPGQGELTDRTGRTSKIVCREKEFSEMLNSVPLYVADKKDFDGLVKTYYFTTESPERVSQILGLARSGMPFDGERTTGLYYKK